MAVFRVEKNKGYTVMSNYHLNDKALTLKAKGLLSQMLSLPDTWDFTLRGLAHINKENIDAIRTAVLELERQGYLRKMALDGYIINVDYTDIKENTAQLQRIGNNINQILKRMNQTGNLYEADVAEIKEILKGIWHTQKSILSSQRLTKH